MLVGITDYARHRGVAVAAVQYAVNRGRIQRDENGLIDQEQADLDWEKNTAHNMARYGPKGPRAPRAAKGSREHHLKQAQAQIHSHAARKKAQAQAEELSDQQRITGPDFNRARAAKEIYEARLKQLEYEEKRGNLVSRKSVELAAFNRERVLRDAALNLPHRLAAQLAAETDEHTVFEVLKEGIMQFLTEYSGGKVV